MASLKYTLVEDLDDELEELGRLTRAGDFRAAKAFFLQHLKQHIENPLVFTLYAELLLEIGDYQSVIQLEDIAHTAVPQHWRSSSALLEDDDNTASSPYTNFRNTQDMSRFYVDLDESWLRSETFDSTQVRIFFLLARLWNIMRFGAQDLKYDLLSGRDWKATYSLLVDEQRAWDFRDMFLAFINLINPDVLFKMNFFFDSETPKDFYDRLKEDWLTGNPDVSVRLFPPHFLTTLVFLSVFSKTSTMILMREIRESSACPQAPQHGHTENLTTSKLPAERCKDEEV
ncbi:hypothetical protein INS49_010627 [Diaporthe citri]|uniref:uncharacterized protein n=1 Tax=Diaporthe citri TaxID=83186 RepID=UPI001C810D65|nr:uncharacterized protein INS49_010627 [Diaporthe citri]KAG6362397.1 hypothetical protein INS49_010627 [Diaporthe citri]